ncbi:MAG: hypothetical protein JSW20_06065 [Nitrospiraceae bacterium]|nr:MAG: hypothetical protein JSW20_06065 [Nitrospiraceae bacterium]
MTTRRAKRHKKGNLLKLGMIVYLGFCLFSIVWLRSEVLNLKYELGELDILKADLINERKMMVATRASTYSTEKIERVATKRLGMTMPERHNVYFVKRSSAAAPYKASLK